MTRPIAATQEDGSGSPAWAIVLALTVGIVGSGLAAAGFIATIRYGKAHHLGFWVFMGLTLVYGAVILAVSYASARIGRRLMRQTPSTAMKRYNRRFMTAMSLYVVALIAAIGADVRLHPTGVLAYALAIIPALPLLAAIAVMGLYLREETDEFQRAVHAEAALWATGGLLAAATVWGFLELFGRVPHAQAWVAFPVWAVMFGIGQIIARRRYS